MIRVLFVCLGNICRSPMAEFVFRDLVTREGLSGEITVESAATSTEALGCDIHRGTRTKLKEEGISFHSRQARQISRRDYEAFDYLIGMEQRNLRAMRQMLGEDRQGKLSLLLDYSHRPGDIADPWYTGNFDQTYDDVLEGCQGLLEQLRTKLHEK